MDINSKTLFRQEMIVFSEIITTVTSFNNVINLETDQPNFKPCHEP